MLELKRDRRVQEALIKCSEDDSAPSISVIRDSWSEMACGWLAVRPLPLYELKASKKNVEWKQKNKGISMKDQRRRDVDSTRRVVAAGINKQQRAWRGDRQSKKMNIINGTILGPLTKVTPAQQQVKDDNLARIASGNSNSNSYRRNVEFRSMKERREREWLPVTSQSSNFALDESRLIVHRHGNVDTTETEGDNSMAMGSKVDHVGLLVRRLIPSGQIIRNLL